MEDFEILDSEPKADKNLDNDIWESFKWWESKRLLFNICIISVELFSCLLYLEGTISFGYEEAIYWSIAFTLVGNIFYFIGWILEFLSKVFDIWVKSFEDSRKYFLFIGIIFSMIVTFNMYSQTLS